MDYSTFAPLVNDSFRLAYAEGAASLELIECARLREDGSPRASEPFSLIFRGPAEPLFAQQIHRLEHERAGVMEIFLVPIRRDAAGIEYQAIFN